MPHPALLDRPEWVFAFDELEQTSTRAQLIEEVVDNDGFVVCGHYPRQRDRSSRDTRRAQCLWEEASMSWPRDDAKLERVRALMAERDLDALVVRAPDNVLYLTNFWGMKGYDACVFPREGEPVLICLEASEEDAARTAWTSDVRLFNGYDERRSAAADVARPRPRAGGGARVRHASGSSSRSGRRRPTAWSGSRRRSRLRGSPGSATSSTRRLFSSTARALKTEQEVERMRLANEIAAAAMEHCRLVIEPGMSEAQIAAEWQGFVHGEGTGWEGKVELALGFSLVWSGPGIKTFTATTARPVVEGEPTLFEIWVCADGYWCDHTKNLVVGELTARYRELEAGLMAVYEDAVDSRVRGRASPSSTAGSATGIAAIGLPGPAVASDLPRCRCASA